MPRSSATSISARDPSWAPPRSKHPARSGSWVCCGVLSGDRVQDVNHLKCQLERLDLIAVGDVTWLVEPRRATLRPAPLRHRAPEEASLAPDRAKRRVVARRTRSSMGYAESAA